MKEERSGIYTAWVTFPVAAEYDLNLILRLKQPKLSHCFRLRAQPDRNKPEALRVDLLTDTRNTVPDQLFRIHFRFSGERTGHTLSKHKRVGVMSFAFPNGGKRRIQAKQKKDGSYEALLPITELGRHYAYVTGPGLENEPAARMPFSFFSSTP